MFIKKIDHIQLAMPAGEEDVARGFYNGLLGLPEKTKPEKLAERGGVWFESDSLKIHLGVDDSFVPARKAHPAFEVSKLEDLSTLFRDHGYTIKEDEVIADCSRFFVNDPFGNRLEFMEWKR